MPDFKSTEVDSGQIDSISNSIDEDISEMKAIAAVLKDTIVSGLTPYWQGQAEQNFEQKFTVFSAGFTELLGDYSSLNTQLKKAGTLYAEADGSVKQHIAKLPK